MPAFRHVAGQCLHRTARPAGLAHQPDLEGAERGEAVLLGQHAHAGPDAHLGHCTHGKAGLHGGVHGVGIGARIGDAVLAACLFQCGQYGGAPLAAGMRDGERHDVEKMRRVPPGGDPDERLAPHRLVGLDVAAEGDECEVHLAAPCPLEQHRGVQAVDVDRHHRVGAGEAGEDLRQEAVGIIIRRAETHRAGEFRALEGGHCLVVHGHQTPGIFDQSFAIGREAAGAAIARKERTAQQLLQPLHLH